MTTRKRVAAFHIYPLVKQPIHIVIASEAKQSRATSKDWIASSPALLAMTVRHASALSRRISPELCNSFALGNRGRREDRVRAAPAVSCANCASKKRTRAYRFSGGSPAFPAQWFYGFLRALPGDLTLLSPFAARIPPRDLTPALRRQDHTTSPYALASLVLRANCVHRIPSRVS
jgi:hypothetical protein